VRAIRPQHLFIVRVWREPGRTPEEGQWRGLVEHVPDGQRRYFTSLDDLSGFLRSHLDDPAGRIDSYRTTTLAGGPTVAQSSNQC
jgi:hypothetical protein